ncbi:PAS-domain containing protein [Sphingomonas sp. NSE70-1]|uniref:histidine kinase n=1 Tax=Sphingomonas caseinilyticus TaxID=2908205 RepID=A0ABT0RRH9_9SPHN|nr:PAS domain-containing sensor histidine kinase [Sphingomonas caseinilyticus]MCL6697618.1 PAS-domain containing protein [Sphingomonas caseinilyticus]
MLSSANASAAIIVLAALWVVFAAALAILAAGRIRRAQSVLGAARTMRSLLDAAPARAMIIHGDGTVDADARLVQELGLSKVPQRIDELTGDGGGFEPDDLSSFIESLADVRLGAAPLRRQLRLAGGDRVLELRAALAPQPAKPGSVLAWLFDISDADVERGALTRRLQQTEGALDALTHLIQNAPFPMWYRGPDLGLGLVNAAFVAAVEGRDAEEVIQRGAELIDATGPEGARAGAEAALESGRPYSRTQPATIGQERRMLRIVDVPLPTGAVAGFAIDIQDLEDARIELASHQESQRELADRMSAGVVQFDDDRQLAFFNQPFAIMAQLEPDWLAERPEFDRVLERMRENGRIPEVRDFPAWKTERRAWFTSPEEAIEEDWILSNGDHLRVLGQPLPDGGLRFIFEDRTEQVRLATARDTLLRVRAATFDNLFEVISVFASDGRLYLWNRRFSELWDLDEGWLAEHPRVDELVPAMAKRLVNPTAAAQVRELVRSTTSGRQSGTGRVSLTDGRHFDFAAVPLPDGNALFTMIDVTDSSRIEAALRERATALEEADRVKTDFVANMSYELRTPLTSVGGFAEMLQAGYAGELPPAASDYVGAILESVDRLSKLIDDVLDLTQADTRGVVLERERVDIAGMCRAAAESLRSRATDKRQKLELDLEPSAGSVIGDARRLRESVEHILRNAVAYTDEGGHIWLKASGDDENATIIVVDDGPGIPPEQQEQVFARFHRSGAARGEAALGLGLPLTRQFVEAHGGSVELESAVGKGTSITISIPRAPQ